MNTSKEEKIPFKPYTTEVGDYLVIWITGITLLYIAEVTQSDPLQMKVEEEGPYAYLKHGDFIIRDSYSALAQEDSKNNTSVFLDKMASQGVKIASGLRSLGIPKGPILYVLPPSCTKQFMEEK